MSCQTNLKEFHGCCCKYINVVPFFGVILVMEFPGFSHLTGRVSEPLQLYDDPNTKMLSHWPNLNYNYYIKGTSE